MRSSLFAAATAALLSTLATAQEQCNGLTDAAKDACDMQAAFGGSKVNPDVIPTFEPTGALYVTFGTVIIGGAQQLSPAKVNAQPTVAFTPSKGAADASAKYLLVMVDHDAPSPANASLADIVHWMASDLTVGSKGVLSSSTAAPAPYGGPNPPQGSAAHRYVFLLYAQPSGFTLPAAAANLPATIGGARLGFDLAAFVADGKLGDPVAGSFFKAVYDGVALPAAPAAASATSTSSSSAARASSAGTGSSGSHSSASRSSSAASSASTPGSATNSSADAASSSSSTTDDSTSGAAGAGFHVFGAGLLGVVALLFV